MKVKHECVRGALASFLFVNQTNEDYECRILVCDDLTICVNIPYNLAFEDFLSIYKKSIVRKGYQLIILDEMSESEIRLTYIQNHQYEVVRVKMNKELYEKFKTNQLTGRLEFHTVHEKPSKYTQFLIHNSHALISYETYLKRRLYRKITKPLNDSISDLYIDDRMRLLLAKMIRLIQRDSDPKAYVCAIPFYKEESVPPLTHVVRRYMTDILIIREPLDEETSTYKITTITNNGISSFIYHKNSFVCHKIELSNDENVRGCIEIKNLFLKTKEEVLVWKELYNKSRPTSKYLGITA